MFVSEAQDQEEYLFGHERVKEDQTEERKEEGQGTVDFFA